VVFGLGIWVFSSLVGDSTSVVLRKFSDRVVIDIAKVDILGKRKTIL
jgi:hypothetical protein